MLSVRPSAGGAFKGAGQLGGFNHSNAVMRAHIAATRTKARAVLGPPKAPAAPVAPLTGPAAPAAPTAPAMGAAAPMAGAVNVPMPHPHGNFKAHIAHAVTHLTGQPVTHNMVQSAIDRMAAKGAVSPFQGEALKQHTGPLVGPQGRQIMTGLANEVMQGFKNAG